VRPCYVTFVDSQCADGTADGFRYCVLVSIIFRLLPVTNMQQHLSVIWPSVSVCCGSFCDGVSTWNKAFLIFDPVYFSRGGLITQRAWWGYALGDHGNRGYCSLQRQWLLLHSVCVACVTSTASCSLSAGDKAGVVWSCILIPEPVPSVFPRYISSWNNDFLDVTETGVRVFSGALPNYTPFTATPRLTYGLRSAEPYTSRILRKWQFS